MNTQKHQTTETVNTKKLNKRNKSKINHTKENTKIHTQKTQNHQ